MERIKTEKENEGVTAVMTTGDNLVIAALVELPDPESPKQKYKDLHQDSAILADWMESAYQRLGKKYGIENMVDLEQLPTFQQRGYIAAVEEVVELYKQDHHFERRISQEDSGKDLELEEEA